MCHSYAATTIAHGHSCAAQTGADLLSAGDIGYGDVLLSSRSGVRVPPGAPTETPVEVSCSMVTSSGGIGTLRVARRMAACRARPFSPRFFVRAAIVSEVAAGCGAGTGEDQPPPALLGQMAGCLGQGRDLRRSHHGVKHAAVNRRLSPLLLTHRWVGHHGAELVVKPPKIAGSMDLHDLDRLAAGVPEGVGQPHGFDDNAAGVAVTTSSPTWRSLPRPRCKSIRPTGYGCAAG